MNLTSVQIENFRGIRNMNLELGKTTVLIGENNTGKTSVLDALKLCLENMTGPHRTVFDPMDFHLPDENAEPSSADPIKITLTFTESQDQPWDEELRISLNRATVAQADENDNYSIYYRLTSNYHQESGNYDVETSFLAPDGLPLSGLSQDVSTILRDELHYHYISALRDVSKHFDTSGPFWRPFLKDSQLSRNKKLEIESSLKKINRLIFSSHSSFEQVKGQFEKLQSMVLLANEDTISIETVPNRMFEILSKAEIQIGTVSGAKIPLARHGEGTQSLAVLMLFFAFVKHQGRGSTIFALEEPEAHLHPSAIRTLCKLIPNYTDQQIISTHSGDIISEIDIHNIRRMARTLSGIQVFSVPDGRLSKQETRMFNYHIRRTRGELLFARCWLLVEGKTEVLIYEAAARACNLYLQEEGVRIVEFGQSEIGMLVKIANFLGIAWYCVGDDDGKRKEIEPKLRQALNDALEEDHFSFPYPSIEEYLILNGFENAYLNYLSEQNKTKLTKSRDESGFLEEFIRLRLYKTYKPRAAADIAIQLEDGDAKTVPSKIRTIIEKSLSLVRG